jgi:uncharacterized protein YaaR (DUF327 family)
VRVENHLKAGIDSLKKEKATSQNRTSFSEVMTQSKGKLNQQALNQLLSRIEEKGALLAQKMTVSHMRDYKKMVKQFVEEAVRHGLELQDRQGYNFRGRPKSYKIVEEIDQKLIELTNEVVQQEKNGIHILSLIGEIKGLMVNLYT